MNDVFLNLVIIVLIFSLIANIILFFLWQNNSSKNENLSEIIIDHAKEIDRLKNKKPDKQDSYEVTELLHDLTSGKALVEIKRVDPNSVFLRSNRE